MFLSSLRIFACLVACGSLVGCSGGEVNNSKMPDLPPPKIEADTAAPKSRGDASQPYGASKKYQDMMNR